MSGKLERSNASPSVATNLISIMLCVALLGIGAAYLIDAASRSARADTRQADTDRTLLRTLGGHELKIPTTWFRYEEQRVDGFAKQIDLRLSLPLGLNGTPQQLDVTLLPRSRVRASAALLDGVYLHQFEDSQLSGGPPGLVGKALKPTGGYAGESVWYDALAGDPFVAKCSKPAEISESQQCLRTVYLGPGLAAVYAFNDEVLQNWRLFDKEMRIKLRQIGAL
jgi:hypothetical protein